MVEFAPLVYVLCFVTSSVCAALLARGYVRSRTKFLLWCAACFVMLALNNLLAVIDLVLLVTQVDLQPARVLSSLAGVLVLLYGFVWEMD